MKSTPESRMHSILLLLLEETTEKVCHCETTGDCVAFPFSYFSCFFFKINQSKILCPGFLQ